jgi:hypothetical protein
MLAVAVQGATNMLTKEMNPGCEGFAKNQYITAHVFVIKLNITILMANRTRIVIGNISEYNI